MSYYVGELDKMLAPGKPHQSFSHLRNRCNRRGCLDAQFHVRENHDSLFVIVYHISDFA